MKTYVKKQWNTASKGLTRLVKQHKLSAYRYSGLAMVCFGIGMIYAPAGVIAGGIALLLIEWSVEDGEDE